MGAAELADHVQSGDVLMLSGGAAQPFGFLAALSRRRDLRRVTVFSSLTLVPPDFLVRQFVASNRGEMPDRNIQFASFCVGPGARQGAASGVVDVVPISAQVIGSFLQERRLDVVVVGASGMDDDGNFNLSCNVDWMPDVLAGADQSDTLVVVEVNPSLPWTEGETTFRIESVDHVIESRRPLVDLPMGAPSREAQAVGGILASLIEDESTLHVGMGDLVSQSLAFLDGKRDLGVHSDWICDVLFHLSERGAVTCRKKGFMPGKWVGSYVLGSQKLYEFVHRNPAVSLHPTDFVAQRATIVRNRRMVSVSQATQVDLTGQVAGQSLNYEVLSNAGIQHVFHASAAAAEEGKGIVVLPSAGAGGKLSNIVTSISRGAGVAIPAVDVDYVVTEQGVARLRGKSVSERVLNLVAIAHPAQRDRLAYEARKLGML
jgi:acyl-CoA hydrolase